MYQAVLLALTLVLGADGNTAHYRDGRPAAKLRLDAVDHGAVLRHGDGPDQCDIHGARDVWIYQAHGTYYMHYDAAGPKGWLAALPSVVRVGNRLALFYDGDAETKMPVGIKSHMNRDIGLAWLHLPLIPPVQDR
jgi:hypothetical protein